MHNKLANDSEYYKYIFKKTEKIVCAVFYILENQPRIEDRSLIIKDIEKTALQTLDTALKSLEGDMHTASFALTKLRYGLIELESKLRILGAAHGLSEDQLRVFVQEIDSVGRTLEHYVNFNRTANPLEAGFGESVEKETALRTYPREAAAETRRTGGETRATETGTGADRKTRIIEVLKGVGEASIKDISEVIGDCSEKTIQRELNALIKDGIVQRKGQRRWSRYSVANQKDEL